ncbi:cellulose biosynthesis cyclic di-GMP-binding regulatory protein BcsB [Parasediminibacterium paludis]|uniref:Cellulose biosynthesis cyclic di-GMP-binding regulatory protein BcsB n=1 Tax=Parasediminibacterium paludis TaxID=908966 RepID=A0ABV8PVJ8_9BACT
MKAKFLLSALFFLFISAISAQSVRTFESMGYDDVSIQGITGSVSYFIKIKPDDNVNQSKLVLRIAASQVLNPNNSFVIVSLKDITVKTTRVQVTPNDSIITIEVPLDSQYLQPDGRFIKLKVAAKMSIGDEYCKDIDNAAVWLNIKNSSHLNAVGQIGSAYQRSLKEWIQEFSSVYSPATADLDDLAAGGIVYTILKQTTSNKKVYTGIYSPQDSLPQGILTGLVDKLPYTVRQVIPSLSAKQGLIALARVNTGLGERTVLVVTGADAEGYRKAINTLASNRRLSSSFSEKVLIDEAVPSYAAVDNQSPLITSLESLGGTPGLLEGIGSLKSKYVFSLTEFNAIPSKLTFHLESYFSVLKPDDRGFLNIYLNQNLVYNANLMNRSNFIEDIDLKPYMLSKFNTLEVEYRFHPGTNICKDGFSNFFAFVNTKTSILTFSGEKENRFYSFFNFPAEFRKVPTKIVVSPSLYNSNLSSSIGELFYQLNAPFNPNYNRLIVPPLVSSDKINLDDLKGYNIIALVNREDNFVKKFTQLPLQFNKDFQLYKDKDGKTNEYSINDFSNSGIAQIFREKGSTILLITATGGDSASKVAFESVIKNFSTQLTEIESNVCIAQSNGKSNSFFKAPEGNDIVSYKGEKNGFAIFWEKFKWFILIGLLVLVLLAFFFVRNKVKESQETFKEL